MKRLPQHHLADILARRGRAGLRECCGKLPDVAIYANEYGTSYVKIVCFKCGKRRTQDVQHWSEVYASHFVTAKARTQTTALDKCRTKWNNYVRTSRQKEQPIKPGDKNNLPTPAAVAGTPAGVEPTTTKTT